MKILVNDEIDTDLWEEFVSGNPHANPFQTPAFYELVNHAIPSSGQAVCVFDQFDNEVRGSQTIFFRGSQDKTGGLEVSDGAGRVGDRIVIRRALLRLKHRPIAA